MKTRQPIVYALLLFLLLLACRKDFVVQNISKKTLTINSPSDNLVTPNNVVTFWWNELDGAEKYNLQIVKPSFAAMTQLITDTNTTATRINISLQPGSYQWRIKAINAGYSTTFQTFSFKVDSSNILTNMVVIPISPLSGNIFGTKTVNFSWNGLPAATNYSIEIKMNGTVINYSTTSSTNYQFAFPITSAANYTCSWRVKAINAMSISQFNNPQTFTIDLLAPAVSTPSLPTNGSLVRDTVDLVWKRISSSDTKYDSIFIYSDASFLNLQLRSVLSTNKVKINQLNTSNPLPAGTSSTTPIQYWWRLRSVDSLGNASGYSNAYTFQLY